MLLSDHGRDAGCPSTGADLAALSCVLPGYVAVRTNSLSNAVGNIGHVDSEIVRLSWGREGRQRRGISGSFRLRCGHGVNVPTSGDFSGRVFLCAFRVPVVLFAVPPRLNDEQILKSCSLYFETAAENLNGLSWPWWLRHSRRGRRQVVSTSRIPVEIALSTTGVTTFIEERSQLGKDFRPHRVRHGST